MAISSSCFNLEEAMDKVWFHNNILFFQPSNFKILSMLQKDGIISESSTSSEDISFYELAQPVVNKNKNKKMVQKTKNHEGLPQSTVLRMPKMRAGHESSELEGFDDLCSVFRKEKFEEGEVEEDGKSCLSEAWFVNRADPPLFMLRRLPETIEGTDMKRYLRFWAQMVASSVCHELYL